MAIKYNRDLSYEAHVDIPSIKWISFLHSIRHIDDYRIGQITQQWDWIEEHMIKYYDGGVDRAEWRLWFNSKEEMIRFRLTWL